MSVRFGVLLLELLSVAESASVSSARYIDHYLCMSIFLLMILWRQVSSNNCFLKPIRLQPPVHNQVGIVFSHNRAVGPMKL